MAVATQFNSEGCHFQCKNSYCRLRGFKAGFLVKGRFGIFLKIHPIWYHHPPQGPSYTIPLKYSISFELFLWRRLSWKGLSIIVQILNICALLFTHFLLFKDLFFTFKIFLFYFSNIFTFKISLLYFPGPAFVSVVTLELRVAIRIEFFTRWACKCEMRKCKCAITN